jgi:hypothetical protein
MIHSSGYSSTVYVQARFKFLRKSFLFIFPQLNNVLWSELTWTSDPHKKIKMTKYRQKNKNIFARDPPMIYNSDWVQSNF